MPESPTFVCSNCGRDYAPEYLMLRLVPWTPSQRSAGVWSSCAYCHEEEPVGLPVELTDTVPVQSQLSAIGLRLFEQTGLAVFRDRPGDPPAGVREPRRQPPDQGSGQISVQP